MPEFSKLPSDRLNELFEIEKQHKKQLSRKEKLVVGSEWECIAECYGEHWTYKPPYKVILKKVGTDYSNYVEILSGTTDDNMPTDQFLLCFKSKGE